MKNSKTGWGWTRGHSSKLHFFEDGRTNCSGSTMREGQTLSRTKPNALRSCCAECVRRFEGLKKHSPQMENRRGVAFLNGRSVDRKRRYLKGTAQLYANT